MSKKFCTIALGSCLLSGLLSGVAIAQGVAQAEIVMPQISVFSASTTVSVPDRGYSSIGGYRSVSTTRTEFGPGFGRGFASRASSSDAGVRVWIHDFQELEEGLAKQDSRGGSPPTGFAARIRQYGNNSSQEKQVTVAAYSTPSKEPRELATSLKIDHAADMLKRGKEAEERGKLKVAVLYYKSVVSLGDPASTRSAQDRLNALEIKLAGR